MRNYSSLSAWKVAFLHSEWRKDPFQGPHGCIGSVLDEPGEESFLGVEAVLGLVPDGAGRAVEDLVGDLPAAVGGQAVQDDGAGSRPAQELGVDLQRAKGADAVQAVVLLAHGGPGVGDE